MLRFKYPHPDALYRSMATDEVLAEKPHPQRTFPKRKLTTIPITIEVRNQLEERKIIKRETWYGVIQRLLDETKP